MAVCFTALLVSFFHTRYNAIPFIIYKVVHTGANIQLGGLNEGLFASAYQPFTPDEVKKPAIPPTT